MCGVFGGERMETGGSMQHGVDMACKTVSGVKSGGPASYESRVAETGTGTAGCTGELGERGEEEAVLPVCMP